MALFPGQKKKTKQKNKKQNINSIVIYNVYILAIHSVLHYLFVYKVAESRGRQNDWLQLSEVEAVLFAPLVPI
jgi:hypothetical protein